MIPVGFFKFKQALTCVYYLVKTESYINRYLVLKNKKDIGCQQSKK